MESFLEAITQEEKVTEGALIEFQYPLSDRQPSMPPMHVREPIEEAAQPCVG